MLNILLAMVNILLVILYIVIAILHIHVGSQISFLQFWIWIWINFENKFPWKLNGGPENFPGNFLHNSNTINLPGGKAFWVFHLNSDTFLHGIISTLNPFDIQQHENLLVAPILLVAIDALLPHILQSFQRHFHCIRDDLIQITVTINNVSERLDCKIWGF